MTDFVAIEQALLNLQADITAQQATVQALIDAVNSDKGAALGIATLDSNSRLQPAQHPPLNSGQIYVGSAGNVPVTESLLSAIASRSTNSANQPLVLDGSGLVSTSNIPSSIVTGASFRGVWNASTNSPTLTSSVGTNGHWYYVGTAGSTTLNGISSWQKGDIVIFNGGATAWEKIDGSDAVLSVQGDASTATPKSGIVNLSLTDFALLDGSIPLGDGSNNVVITNLQTAINARSGGPNQPALLNSSGNLVLPGQLVTAGVGFKGGSFAIGTSVSPASITLPHYFTGFVVYHTTSTATIWRVATRDVAGTQTNHSITIQVESNPGSYVLAHSSGNTYTITGVLSSGHIVSYFGYGA